MVAENDQIELRSEKVRSIIGQIPPLLLRSGIGIIFIIMLILSFMGYYFKYPYTIEAEYYIWESNHKPEGALMVPYDKASGIKSDQRVIINLTNVSFMYNKALFAKIDSISPNVIINEHGGFNKVFIKDIKLGNIHTQIELRGKAHVEIGNLSFWERIRSR